MELRDAIKCLLEYGMFVGDVRGSINMDNHVIDVEFDGGEAPVHYVNYSSEDIDVAIDDYVVYVQNHHCSMIDWPKEGF